MTRRTMLIKFNGFLVFTNVATFGKGMFWNVNIISKLALYLPLLGQVKKTGPEQSKRFARPKILRLGKT